MGRLSFFFATLVVCLAPCLSGCQRSSSPPAQEASDLPSVKTVPLIRKPLQRTTTQPATVHADHQAEIYGRVSGYLKELKPGVDIGKKVKKDEVLAVIHVPELKKAEERQLATIKKLEAEQKRVNALEEVANATITASKAAEKQAKADQAKAQARLKADNAELARIEGLVKNRAAEERLLIEVRQRAESSKAANDAADASFDAAMANLAVAQAKLTAALAEKQVAAEAINVAKKQLEEMQEQMEFANIKAPFDGVITERNIDPGDLVRSRDNSSGGKPLFIIAEIDKVRASVAIPENDAMLVKPGSPITFKLRAKAGAKLTGKVARIGESLDTSTRTMTVEVDFPNEDRKLMPGMYGEITVILQEKKDAMVLPANVVRHDEQGRSFVYVVQSNDTIRVAEVETGIDTGKEIEIVSGLTGSERIVGPMIGRLQNGEKVQIRK